MFRKGGNVGNGIMSGITDRVQAQEGFLPGSTAEMKGAMGVTEEGINLARPINTSVDVPDTTGNINIGLPEDRAIPKYLSEEYTGGITETDLGEPKTVAEYLAQLKEGAGEYGGMDPLTSFLLTAGPSVAGATGFADAVGRLQPATQQLIKQADAKAKYDRDLRKAAVNLGLQEEQKFDDRRFNLLLKADDRSYQDFLRQDERDYLAEVKADDRLYNKDLIKNEREFNLELLKDQRAYNKLIDEDKRDYELQITEKARAYQKFDEKQRKEYEEKLIKEGRAFELQQIIRKEQFELEKLDRITKAEQQFTVKDFAETYKGSRNQASNRVKFENENIEAKIVEKFGDKNFGGLIGGETHGRTDRKLKNAKDRDLGKVYFDVMDGKVKRLRKTKEGYKFEIIEDVATFVEPEQPKVTTTTGETEEDKKKRLEESYGVYLPDVIKNIQEKDKEIPTGGTGA